MSNVFDLERLNLVTEPRQRLFLALVVMASIMSVVNALKTQANDVCYRRHGSMVRVYPSIFVFRFGLDGQSRLTTDIVKSCGYSTPQIRGVMTGFRSLTLLNV